MDIKIKVYLSSQRAAIKLLSTHNEKKINKSKHEIQWHAQSIYIWMGIFEFTLFTFAECMPPHHNW